MTSFRCATVAAISLLVPAARGFSPQLRPHHGGVIPSSRTTTPLGMLPTEVGLDALIQHQTSSLLLSDVPVFDGSSIVDPVVVSNAFWDGLTRQFVSLLIGQLLAATVFGLVTTFAGSQIAKLGGFLSDTVQNQVEKSTTGRTTLRQPPPGYTGEQVIAPDFAKLAQCIAIDFIGTSSELIPLIGEVTDVLWAPIAALLLRSLYPGSKVVFLLEFAEEILPFTDILPLATICWVVDTVFPTSEVARTLQLGIYGQDNADDDNNSPVSSSSSSSSRQWDGTVIDVEPLREEGTGRQLPPPDNKNKWTDRQ